MTLLPPNVKVHLALGYTDMRKGIDGLAMLVQGVLRQDPFSGHLFVFRGRKANLIKIVFWDGTGLCLFTKRLEHGVFLWPPNVAPGETLSLTSAQLSSLLDGVDWRVPEQRWRRLLDARGLHDVAVESTPGVLSDHYDPHAKRLRLSQQVYYAPSVAAAGIAHEAGHALQDAEDYFPMETRTYIVPVVQLASQAAPWLFVTGLMLQLDTLTWAGVILFGSSFLLAFLTLPVEFNASARAKELLISHGIIQGDEQLAGVEKVLGAAAWPYVAAAVSGVGVWLFYVFMLLFRQPTGEPGSRVVGSLEKKKPG